MRSRIMVKLGLLYTSAEGMVRGKIGGHGWPRGAAALIPRWSKDNTTILYELRAAAIINLMRDFLSGTSRCISWTRRRAGRRCGKWRSSLHNEVGGCIFWAAWRPEAASSNCEWEFVNRRPDHATSEHSVFAADSAQTREAGLYCCFFPGDWVGCGVGGAQHISCTVAAAARGC